MVVQFKKKCMVCKKNYVPATSRSGFLVCYDCQKKELSKPIDDPVMKKMFNISEEFYKQNSFLRSIKVNYLRYGNLSDKQIETFKKVVEEVKKNKE